MAIPTELQIPDHGRMLEDIRTYMTQKEALEQQVRMLRVTNDIERLAASEFLANTLIPLWNTIEGKRKMFSLQLRRIATAWDGEFKPALDAVAGMIAYVKQMVLDYQVEQERLAQKRQAELDRQAEAARKAAEARGQEPQIPEEIRPLAPRPEATVRTASGTSTIKKVPVVVIINESLIPRKYLVVDHRRLDPDVKAGIQVPGAKLEYRNELAVRTR